MKRPILLSILMSSLLLVTCAGSGPSGTVEKFYKRIEQGEIDDAFELLSRQARSAAPEDKMKQSLQQMTRQIDARGGVDEFEILEEKVIGQTAEVSIRILYGNGSVENEKASLIEEDGKWRLSPASGAK